MSAAPDDAPAPDAPAGRRIRRLAMSDVFLPYLIGAGEFHYEVIEGGLPADARVVDCRMRDWLLELLIESATFPVVPDGGLIPEMTSPQFRRLPAEGAGDNTRDG